MAAQKLYEFPITHELTAARRKAIDKLIDANAPKSPWPITYEWEESKDILHISSNSLKGEVHFHAKKIEVFGTIPFWAKMLFTKKKQEELGENISDGLKHLGFV